MRLPARASRCQAPVDSRPPPRLVPDLHVRAPPAARRDGARSPQSARPPPGLDPTNSECAATASSGLPSVDDGKDVPGGYGLSTAADDTGQTIDERAADYAEHTERRSPRTAADAERGHGRRAEHNGSNSPENNSDTGNRIRTLSEQSHFGTLWFACVRAQINWPSASVRGLIKWSSALFRVIRGPVKDSSALVPVARQEVVASVRVIRGPAKKSSASVRVIRGRVSLVACPPRPVVRHSRMQRRCQLTCERDRLSL